MRASTLREMTPLLLIATVIVILYIWTPQDIRQQAIGIISGIIAFIMFVPQALRVWKTRADPHALSGVSLMTQYLVISNAVIWGAYAVELREFWVGAPGIINAPLAITIIISVMHARRTQPQKEEIHYVPEPET